MTAPVIDTPTHTPTPDLAALKARQQAAWSSGDYSAVAARIVPIAERLVEAADIAAGSRVLDIATGSGNAAIAAARAGARVVGVDYVQSLLERGRLRAGVEGFDIEFRLGDAEQLPVEDAAFDTVLSVVGVMFTPDQERAAAEILRVTKPGGTIALANWTPGSFVGGMLKTVGKHLPPPAGVKPGPLWGTRERLEELFGDGIRDLVTAEREYVFRFSSAEAFVEFFRATYGPVHKAFAALDADGQAALHADLVALVRSHARSEDGAFAIPSTYLEAFATRA